ncbi:MAG: MFS transporter [Dehalococcoidia bacterium]|nr:MFS transporter [Dehalococcoidia bacterium]
MTSASLSEGIEDTRPRGWAALLLHHLQISSLRLSSFVLGIFLPFITADLGLTPLQAGLLQGVWWITAALAVLPFGIWLSRFRPIPMNLISLLLVTPFLFAQGLAFNFLSLFMARFFAALFHMIGLAARPMLFQQWAARRQYTLINAVGLSQHSLLLAIAISTGALLITALGSWRLAYFGQGAFLLAQVLAWVIVARESRAPTHELGQALHTASQTPLSALRAYPQGWLIGLVMFSLSATWTAIVTFLPTLMAEERDIPLSLGGPLLGFLYYGLIPGALLGSYINRRATNRRLLLTIPALLNVVLALGITLTHGIVPLAVLIAGMGLVWIAVPALEMLPFEFEDIAPREVAAMSALVVTLSALGFAAGPMITGAVAQLTGSLQTGLLAMSLASGVGVVAGIFYPANVAETQGT